jgi:hypothetical protein
MKKNFKSIDNTLQDIIQKYNLEESYTYESIKNNWEVIVNKNISKLIKPIKLEHNVLYLKAKTDYWKDEFEIIKDQIYEQLNEKFDSYKIKDIKFI